MDEHKPFVELGGKFHGMVSLPLLLYPGKQTVHLPLYLLRGSHGILRPCDQHPDIPVTPGILRLDVPIEQSMHLQHRLLIDPPVPERGKHKIIGFCMVHRLEHIPERFPAYRQAVLQEYLRLTLRQGVPLQGVGRPRQSNPVIILYLSQHPALKRAQLIDIFLEEVYLIQYFHLATILSNTLPSYHKTRINDRMNTDPVPFPYQHKLQPFPVGIHRMGDRFRHHLPHNI